LYAKKEGKSYPEEIILVVSQTQATLAAILKIDREGIR